MSRTKRGAGEPAGGLTPGDWLGETRVLVCLGSGGVGKTTTAAALAIAAAMAGRRLGPPPGRRGAGRRAEGPPRGCRRSRTSLSYGSPFRNWS